MLTALIHYIHTCIPSLKTRNSSTIDCSSQMNSFLTYSNLLLKTKLKKATISDCKCQYAKILIFSPPTPYLHTHVFLVDITTLIHYPAAKLPYYYPVLLLLRHAYISSTFFDHEEARKYCFKKELRPLMMICTACCISYLYSVS